MLDKQELHDYKMQTLSCRVFDPHKSYDKLMTQHIDINLSIQARPPYTAVTNKYYELFQTLTTNPFTRSIPFY